MFPYLPEVFVHFPPPSHPTFVSLPGFEPPLQDPVNIKNSDMDFLSISHLTTILSTPTLPRTERHNVCVGKSKSTMITTLNNI